MGRCGDNRQQHSPLIQEYNTQTLKPHSAVEYFSFQTTDLSCWDVRYGSAPTYQRGSEGQTMSPLTCFWPPPSQQQSIWKKKMLLIINWLACVLPLSGVWAMTWASDSDSSLVSSQSSCRLCVCIKRQQLCAYTSSPFTLWGIYWPIPCRISEKEKLML